MYYCYAEIAAMVIANDESLHQEFEHGEACWRWGC